MSDTANSQRRHSIGVVSRRTGLKPDVIRAWERRYRAVQPGRTSTNRRYYTDEQLERLVLLRRATLAGRQIGQVSHLSTPALRDLVAEDEAALSKAATLTKDTPRYAWGKDARSCLEACLAAIENLDSTELRAELEKASVELSQPRLIAELVSPLLEQIGQMWEEGDLRVAHEHFASAVLRTFLSELQHSHIASASAPSLVIGTPAGQLHEMGALLVASVAASEGWRTLYLGSSLPAEELAVAIKKRLGRALALSIVYPDNDPTIDRELLLLRRLVGEGLPILVGGRSAHAYSKTLNRIDAHLITSTKELRARLRLID